MRYLDEINDPQHGAWCRALKVFGDASTRSRQMAIFSADREPTAALACNVERFTYRDGAPLILSVGRYGVFNRHPDDAFAPLGAVDLEEAIF